MGCGICVFTCESVYSYVGGAIIIGVGADKSIYLFGDFSVAYYYDTCRAYGALMIVGGFKIYGCKISHNVKLIFLRANVKILVLIICNSHRSKKSS